MVKITQEIDLYQKLLSKYEEIVILNNALGIIYWDMETYMPKNGIEQKSRQIAMLSGIIHERQIDPEIGSLLKEIKAHKNYEKLSYPEKRNLALIQREYDRNTKVPKALVTALAKQSAIATEVWKKAKAKSDFLLFKPELEKVVDLVKQHARYFDPEKDSYDVLLDLFEPGFSKKIIDKLFSELRDGLIPIIKACGNSSDQPKLSLIMRDCPKEYQERIANDLVKIIKYNVNAGRIDETVHPFTGGFYDDVRITTNYHLDNFASSFFSVMHEGGHGLYEQNLPKKYKYQPIGFSCSAGMHEAQARFIENMIGRSREFWEFYLPRFKKITGKIFTDVELDPFVHTLNKVTPSKIRVEADEATYALHIIIRYEIEKDLFSDNISIGELPNLWNQKMKEYLDIEIENDAEGVLQDTHWSGGGFGYFPDYSLGNVYGGQFLWKINQDLPNWREQTRKGDLSKIINWLVTNIHQKGALYDPLDLVKEVTGEELSVKYFLDYLKEKYSKLYGF